MYRRYAQLEEDAGLCYNQSFLIWARDMMALGKTGPLELLQFTETSSEGSSS